MVCFVSFLAGVLSLLTIFFPLRLILDNEQVATWHSGSHFNIDLQFAVESVESLAADCTSAPRSLTCMKPFTKVCRISFLSNFLSHYFHGLGSLSLREQTINFLL
jgi:hypothetical protein